MLRYGVGQYYKPHMDTLRDEIAGARVATVLLYLNGASLAVSLCPILRVHAIQRQALVDRWSSCSTHRHHHRRHHSCATPLYCCVLSNFYYHTMQAKPTAVFVCTPCVYADVEEGGETAFSDSSNKAWVNASLAGTLGRNLSACARNHVAFKPTKVCDGVGGRWCVCGCGRPLVCVPCACRGASGAGMARSTSHDTP